ncbi:kinase-like domain-containing protein [Mycena crocata]|nr:kinase-like domain-containing protein [Mycena crocata]
MPDSAKLQRASYALELLSNGGLRSHVVAALVSGSSLELLYYDRSVVVKSERFWFPENHRNFLAILSAFASLEHRQWGYPQILKTPEGHSSDMFVGSRLKFNIKNELEETWELQLEEKVFSAQGIIGRGTVVMRAKVIQSPAHIVVKDGEDVIVKWIWAPKTRTAEYDILDRTKQHAVNNEEILKHLPEILHGQVVEIGPETLPGQVIQPTCQQHLAKHLPGYEERELRITIQRELKPITDLNPDDLAEAIKGIFKALRWLHETPQILHRDVSRSNLMYHEKGGNIYGVLNDFDLAVPVTRLPRSTSKQRTGTKPYMAIDLLASLPPIHLYRHDLESLMYVMAFLICRIPGSAMENWNSMDVVNLYSRKLQVITTGFPPPINDTFKPLFVKLNKLRLMFGEGLLKRSNYEAELMGADIPGPASNFDANTLGGCVSFAKFAAILE